MHLEDLLHCLFMGGILKPLWLHGRWNVLGEDEENIIIAHEVCRASKKASIAILNRNIKTVILGLGSWEGHQEWLVPWLQAVKHAKVYGSLWLARLLPPWRPAEIWLLAESRRFCMSGPLIASLPCTSGQLRWRHLLCLQPGISPKFFPFQTQYSVALPRHWQFSVARPAGVPCSLEASHPFP